MKEAEAEEERSPGGHVWQRSRRISSRTGKRAPVQVCSRCGTTVHGYMDVLQPSCDETIVRKVMTA